MKIYSSRFLFVLALLTVSCAWFLAQAELPAGHSRLEQQKRVAMIAKIDADIRHREQEIAAKEHQNQLLRELQLKLRAELDPSVSQTPTHPLAPPLAARVADAAPIPPSAPAEAPVQNPYPVWPLLTIAAGILLPALLLTAFAVTARRRSKVLVRDSAALRDILPKDFHYVGSIPTMRRG